MNALDLNGPRAPERESTLREQGVDTASNYAAKNSAPHGIKQRPKRLIVRVAICGMLPIPAANSLIRRLHPGAA